MHHGEKLDREDVRRNGEADRRRDIILKKAGDIFISRGLAEASMTDIAREAGISRRTLYRYYATKEELAFAIEFSIFRDFREDMEGLMPRLKGTGLEKLRQLFSYLEKYIVENEGRVRFTGEFDHYFAGEYPSAALEREMARIVSGGENPLELLLTEGARDGSLRGDIDVRLRAAAMANSLLAMAQRIVIRGRHLAREQRIDPALMLRDLFAMHLESVRKKK